MSENERRDPDGTETVDIGDADVSAIDIPPSSRGAGQPGQRGHERSLPPPLPPEVRASAAPPPGYASMPPPAPPRSNKFYAMLIVGFVAVGVIVGLAVALGTRGENKQVIVTTSPSGSAASATPPAATGSVMMLPTIDMTDEDAGK